MSTISKARFTHQVRIRDEFNHLDLNCVTRSQLMRDSQQWHTGNSAFYNRKLRLSPKITVPTENSRQPILYKANTQCAGRNWLDSVHSVSVKRHHEVLIARDRHGHRSHVDCAM